MLINALIRQLYCKSCLALLQALSFFSLTNIIFIICRPFKLCGSMQLRVPRGPIQGVKHHLYKSGKFHSFRQHLAGNVFCHYTKIKVSKCYGYSWLKTLMYSNLDWGPLPCGSAAAFNVRVMEWRSRPTENVRPVTRASDTQSLSHTSWSSPMSRSL